VTVIVAPGRLERYASGVRPEHVGQRFKLSLLLLLDACADQERPEQRI
jgi:hypothetical protein